MSFLLGPIERVSIPTDKEGRIKTFGFVEYKHLISVDYALHLFAGTRLFGRELMLRNRSSKGNQRNDPSHHIHPSMSLMHGANPSQHVPLANELNPTQARIQQHQQQLLQQQLLLMATGQNIQSYMDASAKMFNASSAPSEGWFASTRTDRTGSHREHFVERRRDQRDDSRTSRSNPYRRSRSRSPNRNRDHDNSPLSSHQASRQSSNDRNSRKPDDARSNYHRWGRR